jgi:predicted nucleic acid-binding protein
VKLLLDSSVWIEHLRRGILGPLLPRLRGRHQMWMDALVAAELIAGCRSRRERRVVAALIAPFSRAGRLRAASAADLSEAGRALSMLRERGVELRRPPSALLDAAIAVTAVRLGALFVTENARDFDKLARVLPLRWETVAALRTQLSA